MYLVESNTNGSANFCTDDFALALEVYVANDRSELLEGEEGRFREIKIKNCPHCGCKPKICKKRGKYGFMCNGDCWLKSGYYPSIDEAIWGWNKLVKSEEESSQVESDIDAGKELLDKLVSENRLEYNEYSFLHDLLDEL